MSAEAPDPNESWNELEGVFRQAEAMLVTLDRMGLYQAGAYLSMAIDAMRQRHPDLPRG